MSLDFKANQRGKRVLPTVRHVFGVLCVGIGISSLVVLDQFDIVVNGTRSLDAKAFLVWEKVVLLDEGAVVAATMPELLEGKFGDHLFVKKIGGLPGDHVTVQDDGTPCIRDVCYALAEKDGKVVGAALPEGKIPPGHYALFGEGDTSLDSRYAAIGLVPMENLRGRGWAIPWYADWRGHSQ